MDLTRSDFPGVEWCGETGEFIRVDVEKCTGCGGCVNVCLGACWTLRNRKAALRTLDTCMECAACWYVCDAGAIAFSWPKGGTGYRSDYG